MAMNVPPPLTATGTELPALDPSPRGPAPQQYAAPAVVRPHVRDAPALNAENVTPPVTATGTALPALDPSPSSPRAPQPTANQDTEGQRARPLRECTRRWYR